MRTRPLIFTSAILVAILSISMIKLQAQEKNPGMIVHPSNFDISVSPAETTSKDIYVENSTDKEEKISVSTRNFTARGEEGSVEFTDQSYAFALASWMKVSPASAVVPAHGTAKFTVTMTAPTNAEPGGHFASVVFGTTPSKLSGGSGAAVAQEVASLFLVRIPGDVKEEAMVESFNTNQSFYEFGPVSFDTRVKNNGLVHVKPEGEILITNMFGQKFSVPFDGQNVLPNAIRKMDTTWSKHILIGKYTATLILAYGTKNLPLGGSTVFYAFPVRFGAIALVVFILLFLMRKRLSKAFRALIKG